LEPLKNNLPLFAFAFTDLSERLRQYQKTSSYWRLQEHQFFYEYHISLFSSKVLLRQNDHYKGERGAYTNAKNSRATLAFTISKRVRSVLLIRAPASILQQRESHADHCIHRQKSLKRRITKVRNHRSYQYSIQILRRWRRRAACHH
jgi:hypothetical protein